MEIDHTDVTNLTPNDVHVWSVNIPTQLRHIHQFYGILSADERDRAARYIFWRHRSHFIVRRAVLRVILAYYLQEMPSQLRFQYGSHGKPSLLRSDCPSSIRFSVSHSHNLILYAVGSERDLGIDVEYTLAGLPTADLAATAFSPRELVAWYSLSVEARDSAFYICWTRKEAYVKARGDGLSLPLAQFDVSLAPDEPPALLRTLFDPEEAHRWSLENIWTAWGYVASLAVRGPRPRITYWSWADQDLNHTLSPIWGKREG